MSERWYERFARLFQHDFEAKKPLIVYADHPDFQQTNTLRGSIGQGTGGVTESLKNRVIMPMTGSYADTDHVLGHELIHAFQYNIAQSRQGGGLQGLMNNPLWLVEGMAEYLSVGRDSPLTAMWMRDALLRDDFPTIRQMTRERRFFPYRFGQALWAYIGGVYGDDAVTQTFRRALRIGFQPAIQQVLGVSADTLSAQWRRANESAYLPLMEGRSHPDSLGGLLLDEENAGTQNLSPMLSPDGRYVAFLSEKDLFSVDLYVADARTGEIRRKLVNTITDPHSDALRYIDSSGTWSPDGTRFAYVVFADGDNQLRIIDVESGDLVEKIAPETVGAMNNPAWSPDGRYIAFSGMRGGLADLYLWDLQDETLTQLTDDRHGDFHPTWSPDGRTLAFATDRGAETDFDRLTYSRFQIALYDLDSREVETLPLLGNVRHSNPQYSPDGDWIWFLSDADGFSDVYRVRLADLAIERMTRVATGVSGIVAMSPAMSVAARTGEVAFSVFEEFGFKIHRLREDVQGIPVPRVATLADEEPQDVEPEPQQEVEEAAGEAEGDVVREGRNLPPLTPDRFSRVEEYLSDATTGLEPDGMYAAGDGEEYTPSLALDYLGQPSFGVAADQFGSYVGGGASAFFSDMLGNKVLAVAAQAQGTLQDIGGQVAYADLGDRWNWSVSAARIPYILLFQRFGVEDFQGEQVPFVSQLRQRVFETSVGGSIAYPFSMTQRLEFRLGFRRYSFDLEEDRFYLDPFGRIIQGERVQLDDQEPAPINLGEASVALVGDNSFTGFVSPIRGGRYRFGIDATAGTQNFITALADWRRYYGVDRNLTIALRGMHLGRYGDIEGAQGFNQQFNRTQVIQPFFLGWETNIRGYAWESFQVQECTGGQATEDGSCPALDRLFGQRLAVVNLEARIPLFGNEQFGLINFPFVPTELVAFFDAGLAWDQDNPATLEWSRSGLERVPVASTGLSARMNVLGFLVLEAYYAYPFQRPERGAHWGFSLAPGW
jgi:dipeptidyl aminopeptidase/acylaminoacyl peptidase